jgi:hypothetical protein
MKNEEFLRSKDYYHFYKNLFLSLEYFRTFAALGKYSYYFQFFTNNLGFNDINPKEKEVNSLTQAVFYSVELMSRQAWRMEYEFQKECINQMAKSTLTKYKSTVDF